MLYLWPAIPLQTLLLPWSFWLLWDCMEFSLNRASSSRRQALLNLASPTAIARTCAPPEKRRSIAASPAMPHILTATATVSPAKLTGDPDAQPMMQTDNYFFAFLTLPNIVAAFSAMNVWTFMLFGFDKIRAEEGSWRISEGTLLVWAFYGGTIGAYSGRAIFRHKTRKQPFSRRLHIIATLQGIVIAMIAGWFVV